MARAQKLEIDIPTRESLASRLQRVASRTEEIPPLRIALLLYSCALIILLAFGYFQHFRVLPGLLEADEREYFDLSSQLLSGSWTATPRRTIGYPLLLAAGRSLTDSFLVLQVFTTAIYALSVPLIFALARRLTGLSAPAVFAAMLLMLWPTGIFYGTSLYSESVALPFFLIALTLLPTDESLLRDGKFDGRHLAAGAAFGLAAHIRPMYLLFLPVLAVIMWVEGRKLRTALPRFVNVLLGFALVVLPWSLFISERFQQPIILTSNGGETLAGGLTPKLLQMPDYSTIPVTGREVWVGPGKWLPIDQNGYVSDSELTLPYAKLDPLMRQRVIAWITRHPGEAVKLEALKLSYMWGIYPITRNGAAQALLGNLPVIALLLLSIFLLIRVPDARTRYARLWMTALFVSGVALISWGSWRFRQPADAGLLAFCAINLMSRIALAAPRKQQGASSPA